MQKNGTERVLLIVGAGASGMLAAISARVTARKFGIADERFRIVLIERNPKLGNKIAISGGGHCNLTHAGDVRHLLESGFLDKKEQRFLRHAVHRFSNADLLELFGRYGLKTMARENGRVFPESGRAAEVLELMQRMLRDSLAEIVSGARIDRLDCDDRGCSVRAGDRRFEGDAVILAAGGSSWGSSGTTGDGVRLAASAGHTVVRVLPTLAPLWFNAQPRRELVGISLRNVALLAESNGASDSRRGDVLVSHRGVSGPACLSLSRSVASMMASGAQVRIAIDLFPGHNEQALSSYLLDQAAHHGSRLLRTVLQRMPVAPEKLGETENENEEVQTIPNAFASEILRIAKIDETVTMSVLGKQQRQRIVSLLKRLPLGTVRKVPLEQAEVSAGGVALGEVDPKTMRSKLQPRLYCCGELLDYAGEVGGFNLQAAFSTGWVAGLEATQALFGTEPA
ncbi:MAG TPA: aminoacetone oxidase family FAD-binding enzyme [Chlorobaculum parvum]|uniref:Aminoacetone oxidase family FAD-binding enzyme n=1 Tax=Chlorobaculum parvum TaxID=274539 RepID=A0A7C5DCN3_9CHLB|nr:aminoacetone oxidase family FAD-binding enzyme [Chlorobaculum parvum]